MEHFVRVILDSNVKLVENIDASIFPGIELQEHVNDINVLHIPLVRQLTESEADEYAERLTNYLISEGIEDFDLEISTDDIIEDEEETYHGNEFFEQYGIMWFNEDQELDEAEYQGRKVSLGKPTRGDVKKFKVYVRKPNGNVVKVNFGDPNMKIKKSNPARRRSFRARHNCDNPGPRWKARYWSCRKW